MARICLDIFDERWTTFIETQAQANIFHHPAWQNTITQTYIYKAYGLVLQDSFGEIRVALPVAYVNSPYTGRRWKIERLNAWLQNFRRVLVHHEHIAENYLGLLHLACIILLLNVFLR